ncbi:hypothetical protein BDQ17DRAFT_1457728 [Cyathus striatus]|nr:hypothetical protein BDQ17DRAFT_1457728 [Cyathus striatus]
MSHSNIIPPSHVAESDSDADDVSKKLPTPRHKKQKTATTASGSTSTETHGTKKVRGKRGLLNKLTEMPLDILLEILGNLEPLDLLHNRVFDAYEDLPPCPDDMAEPAYASLLFERFCHNESVRDYKSSQNNTYLDDLGLESWG